MHQAGIRRRTAERTCAGLQGWLPLTRRFSNFCPVPRFLCFTMKGAEIWMRSNCREQAITLNGLGHLSVGVIAILRHRQEETLSSTSEPSLNRHAEVAELSVIGQYPADANEPES
jgi:hypothetical protein